MLACTALVGCTNEDELVNNENENQQKGDKAYVMVKINNTESISSRGLDGDFTDGTADEHAIKTVNFYFYSAEGTFVTEGEVWENPTGNEETTQTAIEWQTNVAVALQNLTQKGTPKYVLAVLNKPTSLNLANKSIEQVQKELLTATSGNETNGEDFLVDTESNKKYFIMSNSTYNGGDEVDGIAYFATAIDEDQFFKEPQSSSEYSKNPVEIYVERLAAKTQLKIGQTDGVVNVTEGEATYSAYPLTKVKVSDIKNGEMAVTETQLYAQVYGWDLNATQKQTYLMKNVPAWDSDNLAFDWDDKGNYRANWCLSPNYGTGTYPANYLATDKELDNAGEANVYTLNYVNWANLSNAVNGVDYCAENTNNKEILTGNQNFHATVTEILVKARIVELDATTQKYVPVTLFRYDNVLYRENGYLERLFAKVKPQICYKSGTETANDVTKDIYTYISSEDVTPTYVNEGDGKVSVTFTLKAAAEGETSKAWGEIVDGAFVAYANDAEGTENPQTATQKIEADLNAAFKVLFDKERDPQQASYVLADHYNGGMMYYNIPIEHLRGQTDGGENVTGNPYNEDGEIDVLEAEYGVVRNHWYQITVNKIENLGTAVHDANEDIIPDESNNVLYYIAARINVLSWKVVQQGVNL